MKKLTVRLQKTRKTLLGKLHQKQATQILPLKNTRLELQPINTTKPHNPKKKKKERRRRRRTKSYPERIKNEYKWVLYLGTESKSAIREVWRNGIFRLEMTVKSCRELWA